LRGRRVALRLRAQRCVAPGIERRQVAARLDSLDIKRQPPGVLLQLGLTWYTRNPQEGAG